MQSSVKKTEIRQKHDNTMHISIARLVPKRKRKKGKQDERVLQDNYIHVACLAHNNVVLGDSIIFP